jgi:hypothetical protein
MKVHCFSLQSIVLDKCTYLPSAIGCLPVLSQEVVLRELCKEVMDLHDNYADVTDKLHDKVRWGCVPTLEWFAMHGHVEFNTHAQSSSPISLRL